MESELGEICNGILNLLDNILILNATNGESKVFYLKMKGDYHRYLSEFKTNQERKEEAEATLLAYKSAQVSPNFLFDITIPRVAMYNRIRMHILSEYHFSTDRKLYEALSVRPHMV